MIERCEGRETERKERFRVTRGRGEEKREGTGQEEEEKEEEQQRSNNTTQHTRHKSHGGGCTRRRGVRKLHPHLKNIFVKPPKKIMCRIEENISNYICFS